MALSRREFIGAVSASALLAQGRQADLLLFNGKVVTVDDSFSIRSAVVVKDGRIIAVGGNELRTQYAAARVVDLRGRTVLPGFIDTHIHLGGHSRRYIELTQTKSIAQLQQQIREKATEMGPGEWITGSGWDEYQFAEQRKPVRQDLDAAAPNNPVTLVRAGGHSSVGNSKAIQAADINRATPDPERGLIEHDASGEPNGVIRERNDLYGRLVPRDKPEDVRDSHFENVRDQLKLGITSVIVAGASVNPAVSGSWHEWETIYEKHGTELPRAAVQIQWPGGPGDNTGAAKLKEFGHKTGYGNDRLRIAAIGEMSADGGFTGPTAFTLNDFKGMPGFRGKAMYTPEQMRANIEAGHKMGWQFGIHAIGDAAIVMTAEAIHKVLVANPRNDHRHYLSHFSMCPPDETMRMMAKDKTLIAQQPNFTYTLEGRYTETLEGWHLTKNNPLTTPVKHGIFMAFGSDNLPIGPLVGLYGAVTRKGMSGKVYGPEEAVSMKDAIRMYTRSGAYLTWEEKTKGVLEPGRLADMVVLPGDPLTISPEKLLTMQVEMTIVGGRVVFERG